MKQIVIKLQDEQYNAVLRNAGWVGNDLYHAVKNGTPLPKGCGNNLVDMDRLENMRKMLEDNGVISTRAPNKFHLLILDALATIKENGKWLYKEGYNGKLKCNQCNHFITIGADSNYCPNCGAKMREVEE